MKIIRATVNNHEPWGVRLVEPGNGSVRLVSRAAVELSPRELLNNCKEQQELVFGMQQGKIILVYTRRIESSLASATLGSGIYADNLDPAPGLYTPVLEEFPHLLSRDSNSGVRVMPGVN